MANTCWTYRVARRQITQIPLLHSQPFVGLVFALHIFQYVRQTGNKNFTRFSTGQKWKNSRKCFMELIRGKIVHKPAPNWRDMLGKQETRISRGFNIRKKGIEAKTQELFFMKLIRGKIGHKTTPNWRDMQANTKQEFHERKWKLKLISF